MMPIAGAKRASDQEVFGLAVHPVARVIFPMATRQVYAVLVASSEQVKLPALMFSA